MSHVIRILGRPAVMAGFGLTGLPVRAVTTDLEAADKCREWLEDPSVGVVLIEEGCHDRLPEEITTQFGRRALPMMVPFPGPTWEAPVEGADSYIVELLRQVIGYRVRLR